MAFLDEDTIEKNGWYLQPHYIEIKTSQLDSLINIDVQGNDLGFTTVKFYKADGTEISNQLTADLTCVKTVIQWQPTFDAAIFAARLLQTSTPATDIRMFRKISPSEINRDTAIGGVNLALLGDGIELVSNLRYAPIVPYVPGHDYNKQEFAFTHAAGVKHKVGFLIRLWRK